MQFLHERPLDQFRIGYLSTMYHTSHIIKKEGWVEKDLKIKPEWHLFPTGPAMVEAFAATTIDIGYIGLPPAMIGMEKGVPIQCIAGGHVEGTVMMAPDNYRSLNDLHDISQVLKQFTGKSLGTPTRGSIHDVIIRHLIDQHQESIDIRNFSWADLIPEAFDNGEIAGAVGTPPLAVVCAQECGTKMTIPPHALWPYNPSYGIVVRKEWFRENPLLEEFLKLHEQACNLIRDNPQEAASIVSDAVKVVDSSFVIKVFQISPKYCASLPKTYIDSTMKFVTVLNQLGYIKKDLAEEDIFDRTTIDNIHPEPAHYDHPGSLFDQQT